MKPSDDILTDPLIPEDVIRKMHLGSDSGQKYPKFINRWIMLELLKYYESEFSVIFNHRRNRREREMTPWYHFPLPSWSKILDDPQNFQIYHWHPESPESLFLYLVFPQFQKNPSGCKG